MKKQVTAVVDEVKTTLGNNYDINVKASTLLSKEQVVTIKEAIFNGLVNGEISYNGDLTDVAKVTTYSKSLVDNHLRKHKSLNGNFKYEASGNGPKRDERLRELNNLLKSGQFAEGTEDHTAIVDAIVVRKQELVNAKSAKRTQGKATPIDTSVLPPELQGLVE